jgi:L-ascorbate metabolism protein UlaG (beta-lactamase superfamily)
VDDGVDSIEWLGHASFKIGGETVVYLDPFRIKRDEEADIILISHSHFDHFSLDDIKKVQKPETQILLTGDCTPKPEGRITLVKPGDKLRIKGLEIEAVPAYNTNKPFHPKEKGWVGYLLTIDGEKIYFAGDTDRIPEMKEIKADIGLLPVSGTYVMTAEEAAEAALDLELKIAIPMHYGKPGLVGTVNDADKFKGYLQGRVEVVLKQAK